MCENPVNNAAQVCVLVLCGIPGSGKTTLAKALLAQSDKTRNIGKTGITHMFLNVYCPQSPPASS